MPSKLNPTNLRLTNEVFLQNVKDRVFDMLTRAYMTKTVKLLEQTRAAHIMVQHHLDGVNAIVKKRRVMAKGKRVILKDQTLITTEEIYEKVKNAEDEVKRKKDSAKASKGGRGRNAVSDSSGDAQHPQEASTTAI